LGIKVVLLFVGWFVIADVCCVLTQGFVLVLGSFANVIVIVCFSKVACSCWVVFQCCQASQFKQGFAFVLGCVFNVVGNQGCVVVALVGLPFLMCVVCLRKVLFRF
jgi:hypothetical protein